MHKCHYWLILIKGTLETTVPSMWRPRRWGRGAASGYGMVVGFGLKTCVMWGLWRSAHNGLASLNSNLHSSQRDTHGKAARPRFLQSVYPSGFVSISPCLHPRYSIYLTGFLSPTYLLFLLVSAVSTPLKPAPYFCSWPSGNLKYLPWIWLSCTFRAFLWLTKDFHWLLMDMFFFSFHETTVLSLKVCI